MNISDVTTLIDMILNNIYSERGDVNGDNEINISDVTTLIDIILK